MNNPAEWSYALLVASLVAGSYVLGTRWWRRHRISVRLRRPGAAEGAPPW